MKTFTIAIEQTFSRELEIQAKDVEEAMEIAERMYKNGKIVFNTEKPLFGQMSVMSPKDEVTDWIIFDSNNLVNNTKQINGNKAI